MIIAEEFEERGVELVGAGAELNIHVRSGVAAVFGRVVAALHLEFLDGFDRGVEVDIVRPVVDHGDAIQVHLLPGVAGAIGDDARSSRGCREEVGLADAHTWRQLGELRKGASVERKVDDALARHHLAESGVLGLQQRGRGAHIEGLLHIANLQAEIQPRLLIDLDDDIAGSRGAEARRLDLYRILARDQIPDLIFPVGGAFRRALNAGGCLRDVHRCIGDNAAAGVGDCSKDSCVERLGG